MTSQQKVMIFINLLERYIDLRIREREIRPYSSAMKETRIALEEALMELLNEPH